MRLTLLTLVLVTYVLFVALAMAHETDCTPKIGWIPLGGKKPAGDAVAADVLDGKTFSNKDDMGVNGTMVNNGAITIDPSTFDQNIPAGYHNGSGMVTTDANLTPANIKDGVTIFGVTGNSVQASGTATDADVRAGASYSNSSGASAGTMPTQTLSADTTIVPAGYYNVTTLDVVDTDLASGNIMSGVSIFGVSGNPNVVNTSSGDAVAGDILLDKKAYVDGAEVTGSVPFGSNVEGADGNKTFTIPDGFYNGSKTATATDADLTPENIKSGVEVFGVRGTAPFLVHVILPDFGTTSVSCPAGTAALGGAITSDDEQFAVMCLNEYDSLTWNYNDNTVYCERFFGTASCYCTAICQAQ